MAKVGRPSTFDPAICERAYRACLLGATDEDLAVILGKAVSTISEWKLKFPEFSEALKRGKEEADEKVAARLYERACGYEHDATKIMQYEGVPVLVPYIERYAPDTTAAIFWLKNRQREKWRDVNRSELTGADGKPLEVGLVQPIVNLTVKAKR